MRNLLIIIALLVSISNIATAQTTTVRKIENIEVTDLKNQPAFIPRWGEVNLMVFYIDPDRAGQNKEFTDYLEDSKRLKSPNLWGLGVVNMQDAPFIPNGLIRAIVAKRTEKNGATVLTDATRALAEAWGLGDCNNMFVVCLINRDGELVYYHKGVLSEEDKVEFLREAEALM